MFKVEEGDEHASFQLSHSLQMQFDEPIVEFYEIHLVAPGTKIESQLDDAPDADAAGKHGIGIAHDQSEQIDSFHGRINDVRFLFLNLGQASVEKTVVHEHLT